MNLRTHDQFGYLGDESVGLEPVVDTWSIKTDDDVALNIENGDTGLARFTDRFVNPFGVGVDITVFVFDTAVIEVFHGDMAKRAPFGAVDNDRIWVITHAYKYNTAYFTKYSMVSIGQSL
jgi:hypothetical protein